MKVQGILLLVLLLCTVFVFGCAHNSIYYDPEINENGELFTPV